MTYGPAFTLFEVSLSDNVTTVFLTENPSYDVSESNYSRTRRNVNCLFSCTSPNLKAVEHVKNLIQMPELRPILRSVSE